MQATTDTGYQDASLHTSMTFISTLTTFMDDEKAGACSPSHVYHPQRCA